MVETGCDSRATFVTVTVTSDGYRVGQELLQAATAAKEPKLVVRNTFLDLEDLGRCRRGCRKKVRYADAL